MTATRSRQTRKLRVLQLVGEAAGPVGMVGGQAIDLQAAGQTPGPRITLDADGLRAMHARKTGALIRAAASAGAIMAGADGGGRGGDRSLRNGARPRVSDRRRHSGRRRHAPQISARPTGKDAAEAKPTYPAFFGIERSRALAAECVGRANAALASVDLADSHLAAIADWVVTRKN